MQNRKYYVDVLKFIGICCLFFAHVNGPEFLENIRGFDVPMMVILSGFLAVSSFAKVSNPLSYIWKRIKRLVIPTWMFLIIFYLCMMVSGQSVKHLDVLKSYLFQRDCGLAGGVWIIWVYLLCAVMGPILKKGMDHKWFLPVAIGVFIAYEILVASFPNLIEIRMLYYSVFTAIPYGIILLLGMYLSKLDISKRMIILVCATVVHLMLVGYYVLNQGDYQLISQYKYPARLYYLSYGLSITIILIELFRRIEDKLPRLKLITFVSEHSLWIYLWQIMMLTIVNYVINISNNWLLSWLVLMIGSILLTWVQNFIVDRIQRKYKWKILQYFRG